MRLSYILLTLAILASGGYCWYLIAQLDNQHDKAINLRYQSCLETGKDSATCVLEEMHRRSLQC